MTADAIRQGIYRRLSNLRRRHPTHYAQLLVGFWHVVPAWVEDAGPLCPWWGSPEARALYESLNERNLHG